MIISASYKTDIPTFYGEWFYNRLRAGKCMAVNPYSGQNYPVDLSPEQVDGFVFWTKNIGPFIKYLPVVHKLGIPFVVQHSINGYPRELESRVINYAHTIEHMKHLAADYGSERLVWRYDPIVFSSLTPLDWHRKNFAQLAKQLEGTTDEVVISFAQLYKKTARNMELAAQEHNFSWDEHKSEEFVLEQGKKLVLELAQVAQAHKMHLKICSQKKFLIEGVVEEAKCVDAARLERIAGTNIRNIQQKGNRKECGCFASRDIGEYDTCPHGCAYCYAVHNRDIALTRYREHNPNSEFLFEPKGYKPEQDEEQQATSIIKISKRKRSAQHSNEHKQQDQVQQETMF